MKIRIFWIGKTKERYAAEGIQAYLAKLKPFAEVELVEIKEEKGVPKEAALIREGGRILKQTSKFMLFDETGRELASTKFAALIKDKSDMDFVIGGPYGVSDEIKSRAEYAISLSKMTFTHEMSRIIVLEQIYRAVMINSGRGYHH